MKKSILLCLALVPLYLKAMDSKDVQVTFQIRGQHGVVTVWVPESATVEQAVQKLLEQTKLSGIKSARISDNFYTPDQLSQVSVKEVSGSSDYFVAVVPTTEPIIGRKPVTINFSIKLKAPQNTSLQNVIQALKVKVPTLANPNVGFWMDGKPLTTEGLEVNLTGDITYLIDIVLP